MGYVSRQAKAEKKEKLDRHRLMFEAKYGVSPKMAQKWAEMYKFEDICSWCDMLLEEGGRWVEIDWEQQCTTPGLESITYLQFPLTTNDPA